ncbi:MAG: FAD:protein FMN transferase, partial [Candidatus Sericytochromatia bacterium]
WGFKDKDFVFPNKKQIFDIKKNIGYKNIVLDRKNKTVLIKNKSTTLDFGASGKGLAIEKAKDILKKNDIKSAIIDSVSNQYYIGTNNGKSWKVGIKNPRNTSENLKYIDVVDSAVSTSGDYEQFFIFNNKRYSHILDPISGFPVSDSIASTIIYKDSHDSDILSTSVLLLDDSKISSILKLFPNIYCFKVLNNKNKIITKEYK